VQDENVPQNLFVLLIEGFRSGSNQNFIYIQVAQYAQDPAKSFIALGLSVGGEVLLGNCIEG
jgi:hypothetical protein